MADKPINFSAPMIRALLDGRKTQTRRSIKVKEDLADHTFTGDLVNYYGDRRLGMVVEGSTLVQPIPYAPGDPLWVKEDHWAVGHWEKTGELTKTGRPEWRFLRDWSRAVVFEKPGHLAPDRTHYGWHKRNGRFMWRADSRLTLTVTDVRVQRLQEISYNDTRAEGIEATEIWQRRQSACLEHNEECGSVCRDSFRDLWNSLHGPDAWDANPWVVALTFDVYRCNIDQMEAT